MSDLLAGAAAGCVATVPMTAAMEALYRQLPRPERYPLPPRETAQKVSEELNVWQQLGERERLAVTLLSHFGYGAAMGALYGPLARALKLPPWLGGPAYGLAVWAGNYLGVLPALNILKPATEHPPRRTAVMIAAHLVWGLSTAVLVDVAQQRGSESRR